MDVFQDLVQTYNFRKHRMIGFTPYEAENNSDIHLQMRLNLSKYHDKLKSKKLFLRLVIVFVLQNYVQSLAEDTRNDSTKKYLKSIKYLQTRKYLFITYHLTMRKKKLEVDFMHSN